MINTISKMIKNFPALVAKKLAVALFKLAKFWRGIWPIQQLQIQLLLWFGRFTSHKSVIMTTKYGLHRTKK